MTQKEAQQKNFSSLASAETTEANGLKFLIQNGFTVGASSRK